MAGNLNSSRSHLITAVLEHARKKLEKKSLSSAGLSIETELMPHNCLNPYYKYAYHLDDADICTHTPRQATRGVRSFILLQA